MGASAALALGAAATAASAAAIASAVLSRRLRAVDSAFWHAVWTSIALASLAAPFASLVTIKWQLAIVLGPTNPFAANASQWIDRMTFAATWGGVLAVSGAAIMVSRLAWGCRLALRLARHARPVSLSERARIDRLVAGAGALCRFHDRLRVPVAIGWRQGVIVLPASAGEWPDDRLRAIVAHEQRHIVRHDFLWNFVAAVQQAVYWWNPLAWMVARRVRLTAELASDRDAAATGAAAYARHLIATAQELTHFASPHKILAPGAISDLEARVDALLNDEEAGDSRRLSGRATRLAVALIAAMVIVAPVLVRAQIARHPTPAMHAARHAQRHQH